MYFSIDVYFYLFTVGCSVEHDCVRQDEADNGDDRTGKTLPQFHEASLLGSLRRLTSSGFDSKLKLSTYLI